MYEPFLLIKSGNIVILLKIFHIIMEREKVYEKILSDIYFINTFSFFCKR